MGRQSGKRPGFDRSVSYVGQGMFMDCPVEIDGVSTPTKGWVDDVVTDYALEHLDQRPQDKPFLMFVGYKSAHGPRTPPERHREAYAGEPIGPVHDEGVAAPYIATFRRADANADDDAQPKAATKKAAAKKAAAKKAAGTGGAQGEGVLNYLRTLQGVDDNVGRLLKALDDKKLADDTMVVFMSDNGYYLGEHHLGDKRSAYDESLRIPFFVRWPGFGAARRGAVVDQMVLNIDLAPTILDLAGAPIPAAMQGRSWRALAEGREPKDPWRKAFFYEYYYENPYAIPTVFALRTDTAKLIVYPGHPDWEELFDLTADPRETRNLIHDESARPLRDDLRRPRDDAGHGTGEVRGRQGGVGQTRRHQPLHEPGGASLGAGEDLVAQRPDGGIGEGLVRDHRQHPVVAGPRGEVAGHRLAGGALGGAGVQPFLQLPELPAHPVGDGPEDVVLGGEVGVDGRPGHPRLRGEDADRGAVVAVRTERGLGHVEQPVALVLRAPRPAAQT